MRWFLLVTLLVTPSAFARSGSISGTQVSKLTLGVDEGVVPLPLPPPSINLTGLSVRLIDHQIQLLEFSRGSFAGPIASLAFGGAALVAGAVMLPLAAGIPFVALMLMGGSALPLLIGVVWLVGNIGFNADIDRAIKKLRDERSALGAPPVAQLHLPASEPELLQVVSF